MKIAHCSDLHIYTHSGIYPNITNYHNADVLIIAGDVQEYALDERYESFFEFASSEFKHVIIVEGNHEFYYTDINHPKPKYADNVHILRDESIVIDGKTFFGGTMWTNFSGADYNDLLYISNSIPDFSYIKMGGKLFSLLDCNNLYNNYMNELSTLLITNPDNEVVVISHFAPTRKSIHHRFAGNGMNSYFCNDLEYYISVNPKITHWIHGHTHDEFDYKVGNARILCNPRGYPHEENQFSLKYFEV